MRILICEDEEIMLTALEFRLMRQGFEVLKAQDGKEAVEILEQESVDLVIADVMMPHITGLELIDHIRKVRGETLPVIVISALEHDEVVLEAFKKGASDFITKPFKPSELVIRIRKIFQESEVV